MPKKTVTYKEPADYFTPEMRKVAQDWDKAHAKQGGQSTGKAPKGKAPEVKGSGKKK